MAFSLLVAVGLACEAGCSLRDNPLSTNANGDGAAGRAAGTGGRGGDTGGNRGFGGGNVGTGATGSGGATPVDAGESVDAPLPDAPADVTGTKELASACSSASECGSGNCVDGVCCDTACADGCSQCNLKDFVGHCSPVPAGGSAPAPHPACPKTAASTCKQTGVCDGKGACQLFPSGEVCGGGTCNATTQMSVTGSACDGLGVCKLAPALACTPFKCKSDGSGCATTCVGDTDCQGQPCVAGSCGKVADGSRCTTAAQCTSGNCVDAYCCDLACAGACQACDLSGNLGRCTTLPANQLPRNSRSACAAGTCGSHCDGTATACVFAPATTSCGAAKCTDGMVTAAVSCDGMGACPPATVTSCGGFACTGATCKTTCAADTDCVAATPYCSAGRCQAKKPNGRTCTAGAECALGNCVDGVCCSTSSCPACQACSVGGTGVCGAKAVAAPDAGCIAANCQTGTCNGMGACNRAGDGAMCGTNRYCRMGACGACTPSMSCTPTNPCKNGVTSCATGAMVCTETTTKTGSLCGAGASCAGTTKTNAATCNATAMCVATTESCINGCNAARTDCLICTGAQVACGGICCPATAPICSANACVGCTGDQDCGRSTPSCDLPTHTCVCRRQNPGNLFSNAGFNTNLANWTVTTGTWSSDDSEVCPGSGSLHGVFGTFTQTIAACVIVNGGGMYSFGFKYKYALANATAGLLCYLTPYADTACMTLGMEEFGPGLGPPVSTAWTTASTTWLVPSDASSAGLTCTLDNVNIDQIYLNASGTF